jgi:glycosyltransferase involved in cell wall biosynthesis
MPSYNQADFLPAALDSVLSYQGELELIVMDGGSDDGSVQVLERYAPRLTHWQSAPDGGQAAAVNAGFARARGEVLCWLNSDDMHLPGALSRVVAAAGPTPRRFFRYGSAVHLRERPVLEVDLAPAQPDEDDRLLHDAVVVAAQRVLVEGRLGGHRTAGRDAALRLRLGVVHPAREHAVLEHVAEVYSVYRLHDAHKTGSGGARRRAEICEVVRRHGREPWVSRYRRLLDLVDGEEARILRLQARGLSFHRAALLVAARRGMVPRSARRLAGGRSCCACTREARPARLGSTG